MKVQKEGESGIGQGRSPAMPLGQFEHEVDRADVLVQEAIERLSRRYPDNATCKAALEDLHRLRPHFEGALSALTEIERCRGLTHKELSHRRAFKMLLEGMQ
jgi:hypothetical protein